MWQRPGRAAPALAVAGALIVVGGCLGPGGPSYRDLAANESFATTMPDACDAGPSGGNDARATIEGSFYAYATRVVIAKVDEEGVVAWHRANFEAEGWTPIAYPYIATRDGTFPGNAWRRGDLVLGLGFLKRGWANETCRSFGPTVYELTITYQPDARHDGKPRAS